MTDSNPTPLTHRDLFDFFGAIAADKTKGTDGTTLNASDLRVACSILGHLNRTTGMCFVTDETLKEGAGCDERQVRKSVKKLVDHGWFEVKRYRGRGLATEYYPAMEKRGDLPAFRNPKNRANPPRENRANPSEKEGESVQENRANPPALPQCSTTEATTAALITGDDDASAAAFFLDKTYGDFIREHWPDAPLAEWEKLRPAFLELLEIAKGDVAFVEAHLVERLHWLKAKDRAAPHSPLFVRDSLSEALAKRTFINAEVAGNA